VLNTAWYKGALIFSQPSFQNQSMKK